MTSTTHESVSELVEDTDRKKSRDLSRLYFEFWILNFEFKKNAPFRSAFF